VISPFYDDEDGTVLLTRSDGYDWPANIHTAGGEAPEELVWNGTYDYEYTTVGLTTGMYDDIVVGTTGSIDFAPGDNADEYTVSHTMFNYYYGAGEALGTLTYDYATGLISISGELQEVWEVKSVDGTNLEIFWSNNYDDEDGRVLLKRSDGYNWPANIHKE
jgi:hypothetical protein